MLEWNYAEVISALITSPQPLMLFRSIKTIKVQTSSADKTALPWRNTAGWHRRAEVFLLRVTKKCPKRWGGEGVKKTKKQKTGNIIKTLNLVKFIICFMESSLRPKKDRLTSGKMVMGSDISQKNQNVKVGVCLFPSV